MKDHWEKNKATPRFIPGDIVTNDYVHCLIISLDDPLYDVYSIIMLDDQYRHLHRKVYLNETWRIA